MYQVVDYTAKEVFINYIVLLSACIAAFSFIMLMYSLVCKGGSIWR